MNRLYMYEFLRMQEFLEQSFRSRITVNDVARVGGYSPWHCRRIFQQYLGESLSKRLLRLRLEEGKRELRKGTSVSKTATAVGFGSREGFTKAFTAAYGISPGQYAKGIPTQEPYRESYEYRISPHLWSLGTNPTKDGLWEFSYYNKDTNIPHKMRWNKEREHFEAPFVKASVEDPAWYCRIRLDGYGMHPGKNCNAVKSFHCPKSGMLEYFIALGRISELYDGSNPCSVELLHNETPIFPPNGPLVLTDRQPVFLRGTCRVSEGDRISIVLDAMGHMGRDGIMLYRQEMKYLDILTE